MGKRTASSEVIDKFLVSFGILGTAYLALVAPNSLAALEKPLTKLLGRKQARDAKRIAQYMKDKKIIKVVSNQDGSYLVTLTEKGRRRAQKAYFDALTIPDEAWDGKWRIFMFDIPEKYKPLRDFISFHVKRIGFVQLQRSVFVFPYPIDKFVAILNDINPEVAPYIVTTVSSEIDRHNSLVHKFRHIL